MLASSSVVSPQRRSLLRGRSLPSDRWHPEVQKLLYWLVSTADATPRLTAVELYSNLSVHCRSQCVFHCRRSRLAPHEVPKNVC